MPDNEGHATDDELLDSALPMPKEVEDDDLEELEVLDDGVDHELDPIEVGDLSTGGMDPAEMSSTKITAFGVRKPHEDHWNRTPNVNGTGAIHVRPSSPSSAWTRSTTWTPRSTSGWTLIRSTRLSS